MTKRNKNIDESQFSQSLRLILKFNRAQPPYSKTDQMVKKVPLDSIEKMVQFVTDHVKVDPQGHHTSYSERPFDRFKTLLDQGRKLRRIQKDGYQIDPTYFEQVRCLTGLKTDDVDLCIDTLNLGIDLWLTVHSIWLNWNRPEGVEYHNPIEYPFAKEFGDHVGFTITFKDTDRWSNERLKKMGFKVKEE